MSKTEAETVPKVSSPYILYNAHHSDLYSKPPFLEPFLQKGTGIYGIHFAYTKTFQNPDVEPPRILAAEEEASFGLHEHALRHISLTLRL